jgi:hypothetical protein
VKDADSTWALVIGIDTYDNFTHLKGAAADSAATVGWLRKLGVPDDQIMLHAAPCAASESLIEGLDLAANDCTEGAIWESFERLRDNHGARLFVFLAGHGFYEPTGHRVFLTREASKKTLNNLGIAWYARLLRGLRYDAQILVMDGCLNLPYDASRRMKFEEGKHPVVVPESPLDTSIQVLCFAAGQGQKAKEVDGRGLFTSKLLGALDPEKPDTRCLVIDEATGTLQLDIFRAVQEVAGPAIVKATGQAWERQEPGAQYLSESSTPRVFPAVELPTADPARLSIAVRPGAALPDVTHVKLWAERTGWERKLMPDELESGPYVGVLPPELAVTARCLLEPGVAWIEPGLEEFTTAGETNIVFDLKPPAESQEGPPAVQTIDEHGRTVREITPRRRRGVKRSLAKRRRGAIEEIGLGGGGEDAFIFDLPEFEIAEIAQTEGDFATEIARALTEETPEGVHAVVRQQSALQPATALEIPMTYARAIRLAGFWTDAPVIKVADTAVSPNTLVGAPTVPVDGASTVRIELPWGTWSQRFEVPRGETTRVTLPKTIGIPPLRALMLRDDDGEEDAPGSVITARADLSGSNIVDTDGRSVGGRLEARPEAWRPTWTGRAFDPRPNEVRLPRWQRYVSRDGLRFPLNEVGAIALNLGRAVRAEPLSRTRSKQWDRVVSFGELARLTDSEAESLASRKWDDLLLGLAGAYSCYANGQDAFLAGTLDNLRELEPDLPDVAILEAALDARQKKERSEVSRRLWNAGIPVFRWGVAIGRLAAEHYQAEGLGERLRTVESGLVELSTWTLWHEQPRD